MHVQSNANKSENIRCKKNYAHGDWVRGCGEERENRNEIEQ